MSIPNDGGHEIANPQMDSLSDTQATEKDTPQQTDQNLEDSNQSVQNSEEDTQKGRDDVSGVIDELKSVKADIEREKFELDKSKVEADPYYLKKIAEKDPKRANLIAKRLTDGQFTNSDELLDAYEQQTKYAKKDEDVAELLKWRDQEEKRKKKEAQARKEQEWEKAKSNLYAKYPDLSPDNDKDNKKWQKLMGEFKHLKGLDYEQALTKAAKLAFDDLDEADSRKLQNESGSLPSMGGVRNESSGPKTDQEQIEDKFMKSWRPIFKR